MNRQTGICIDEQTDNKCMDEQTDRNIQRGHRDRQTGICKEGQRDKQTGICTGTQTYRNMHRLYSLQYSTDSILHRAETINNSGIERHVQYRKTGIDV